MLNLELLGYLNEYNLNLPIWGLSFLFAYSLVLIFSLETATRHRVSIKDTFNLVSIVAIFSILGARIFYLSTIQVELDWSSILSWKEIFYYGKLNIVGGYLFGFLAGWFYLKGFDFIQRSGMSWLRFFDIFLPMISIGMIFGYIGIFFITLNKGAISSYEYPWLIPAGNTYVHPWALYVSIGYIILLVIISLLYNKFYSFRESGYITTFFILGISIIHFITDFWQTTDPQYSTSRISIFTVTQLLCIIIILITSIILLFIRNKLIQFK